MTDKEIIQALRICVSHEEKGCGLCKQMPFMHCQERLANEAITLIERLQAENTALREGASLGRVKRPQKIAYEKSIEFLRAVTDGQSCRCNANPAATHIKKYRRPENRCSAGAGSGRTLSGTPIFAAMPGNAEK